MTTTPAPRLDPRFNTVNLIRDNGSSIYHSLQMEVRKSLTRGLQIQAGYTWSRSIDNGSGVRTTDGDQLTPSDNYNLAAERGLPVDMHCDESDDPHSRHVETLAFETQRLGLHGRVTGSHLTSMHSMDNYYVSKLIPLMAEADLGVVANPLINITLQGRHDTYPKRRGMTRVPELMAAGVNVGFGHDCVMDPWYSLGSGDMLEVAAMGLHVAQMTSQAGMQACFEAVTTNSARILGLEGYGLAPGCRGSFVLLQARTPVEALRLRAHRLLVVREGRVLAESAPLQARLQLPGRPAEVDWTLRRGPHD